MRVVRLWVWMIAPLLAAQSEGDSAALLAGIRAKMQTNLNRLPNYVCQQNIERSRRQGRIGPYQPLDTLRLEVGLLGNRELYSWQDADRFEEKELADMIGRGVTGTGNFALLAKHVFLAGVAEFTWRGPETLAGRPAVRFDYDVPLHLSSYRLRVPPHQAVIGFHGSFWADVRTLEALRLEVRSEEIPEALGMAEVHMNVDYARLPIGDSNFLLPTSSEFRMVSVSGEESRNLTQFTGCRQYQSESTLSFAEPAADRPDMKREAAESRLPAGVWLELALDGDIDLESTAVGDPVRAVLTRPVKNGERVVIAEGAAVLGRVLRLEKQMLPFEHYIVALQFHTLEFAGRRARFAATMEDAGPASGLIRQAKRLNPTFTRQRRPRMEILVREQHAGQGVLHWTAKHPRIGKGLKMRWQIQGGG